MVWKEDIIILWSPKYEGHWWSSVWHMTGVWKLRYVTLSYVMICDILYVIFHDQYSAVLTQPKQVPVPAPPYPIHVGLSEGQNYKKDRANFYFVDKGMEVGYAG